MDVAVAARARRGAPPRASSSASASTSSSVAVSEAYVREDVACGSVLCAAHAAVNARLAHGCALSDGTEDGVGAHAALRARACYVFPDRAALEAYGGGVRRARVRERCRGIEVYVGCVGAIIARVCAESRTYRA